MPSTFSWLDYSDHERRQMLDVIDLFGERTTRDELGLGGVRDAFADLLFPGTSTIQTRAKYFVLVPWCYLWLERKQNASAVIADRARKLELNLARTLEQLSDTEGVIGSVAKEQLRRLPSSVYWQGLATWGIRTFDGSQDAYHRSLDLYHARTRARRTALPEFDGESHHADVQNWHVGLPTIPAEFPANIGMALAPSEAAYLQERIVTNCSGSLMAYLLRERCAVGRARFCWELAEDLPVKLQEEVRHGQNFSEVVYGAQLLYNLILAEQKAWPAKIDDYRAGLTDWWRLIVAREEPLHAWDQQRFWSIVLRVNPRISSPARSFIDRWRDLVFAATNVEAIVSGSAARQLVEHRESQLKGGLARTRNARARELWNGAAGATQLDLRWNSARRIIGDILSGLEAEPDA
jgi:hypothetical protein